MSPMSEFAVTEATVEVTIDAPTNTVWRALVEDTGAWWPADYYAGAAPRAMRIEARPGGLMVEDWGDGQGMVWATVTGVRRGEWLMLSGELTRAFGGPARSIQEIRLAATGGGTRVTLADTAFGAVSAATGASLESGWRQLLAEGLKPWVETGAAPASGPA